MHRVCIIARNLVLEAKPSYDAEGNDAILVTPFHMAKLAELLVKAGYLVKK